MWLVDLVRSNTELGVSEFIPDLWRMNPKRGTKCYQEQALLPQKQVSSSHLHGEPRLAVWEMGSLGQKGMGHGTITQGTNSIFRWISPITGINCDIFRREIRGLETSRNSTQSPGTQYNMVVCGWVVGWGLCPFEALITAGVSFPPTNSIFHGKSHLPW